MKSFAKVSAIAAALLVLLGGCSGGSKASSSSVQTIEPGVLKVCLYPGFSPFAIKADDGTWSGWDVEYLQGFAAQHGLKFEPVDIAKFDNIWMRPANNECDIAATGITRTDDRVAQTGPNLPWSDVYYGVARGLAVPKGTVVNGINDLAGKVVVTTKGATADIDLLARIAKSGLGDIQVRYVDGQELGAQLVAAGGPGAAIGFAEGVGSIQTLIQQFPGLELAWEHCFMLPDGTVSSEPFAFPVRSGSTGLLAALNAHIAKPSFPYPGGLGSGRNCPTGS